MASDQNSGKGMSLAEKVARHLPGKGAGIMVDHYTGWSQSDADQVVSLNKFFRAELGKAPVSTIDERSCLRDDLDPSVWLKYFESHVKPTLLRFNLPSE